MRSLEQFSFECGADVSSAVNGRPEVRPTSWVNPFENCSRGGWIERVDYSYQFRREGEAGFLRYDNTHRAHHKHTGDQITELDRPPLLIEFLRDVEEIITSGL
jgi:hypothetical protein